MNKQELMAAFEEALAVLVETEETPQSEWEYPDEEVQWYFLVFCAGVNYKEKVV